MDVRRTDGIPSTDCCSRESQDKLAFQGVDAIKWKYTVMPFGPTNGPATFINFIYDINSIWQKLATE
jgi:hypothetical protein